jgi:hypothetical protein
MKEVKEVVSGDSSVYWTGSYRKKRGCYCICGSEPFLTAVQTDQPVCLATAGVTNKERVVVQDLYRCEECEVLVM